MKKFVSKKELKKKIEILETINLNLRWDLMIAKNRLEWHDTTPSFDDPYKMIRIESKGLDPQIIHDYIVEHWDDMLPTYKVEL